MMLYTSQRSESLECMYQNTVYRQLSISDWINSNCMMHVMLRVKIFGHILVNTTITITLYIYWQSYIAPNDTYKLSQSQHRSSKSMHTRCYTTVPYNSKLSLLSVSKVAIVISRYYCYNWHSSQFSNLTSNNKVLYCTILYYTIVTILVVEIKVLFVVPLHC